jgi:beta-N-acetylhexosaminidase
LIVGGFRGTRLPTNFARALSAGERGGAILFRRNLVPDDALAVHALTQTISATAPEPPIVAVDQEGGRVARLGPPVLRLPPAAKLARADQGLLERIGEAQGLELRALGFTTALSPVLDVHTRPENPIIGDRAFGTEPAIAAEKALAFARGLRKSGVFACGKHYPGHGDTTQDSHLELPVVAADRRRLEAVELATFRAAAQAGIESLMTAHVVYPALDEKPATLSHRIATAILRDELGFRGVLFSDDLEMQAVAAGAPIEELAVEAIRAGCDSLLICEDEEKQERAAEALTREAERDSAFAERCRQADARLMALRKAFPPKPARDRAELAAAIGQERSRAVSAEMAERGILS